MTDVEPREEALGILYAADSMGTPPDLTGASARVVRMVEGVWSERSEIDRVISSISQGWRIERMPPVDRNILRLGAYELLHTDTPIGVVLSQAVEMAKKFSTSSSGRFVNGVLGRLADTQDVTLDEAPTE